MLPPITRDQLIKITDTLYEIPASFHEMMRVPARIVVNETLLDEIIKDRSLNQLINVTTLPGIQRAAYAMPDIHQGYGFPIGGVAATDIAHEGIISPGGIGYDINCGVRLLALNIFAHELSRKDLEQLATNINRAVPSGVGTGGIYKLSKPEMVQVLNQGAPHMLARGFGEEQDIHFCESGGALARADAKLVSEHAQERGLNQLGTLGSGNHFLELQKVSDIYDQAVADAFGISKGMITIMIHCGSRGLGHQTCTDYVQQMVTKLSTWNITLPDRELACAPFTSTEGQNYFAAMNAAANFAWANRHMIGHATRTAIHDTLGTNVTVKTMYDVSHNIGKLEEHMIDGHLRKLLVHRKGATRAFPAGNPEVPQPYRAVGHPVFIPGTMGTSSYILVGTEQGMGEAFGSSCHGAGRRMSRTKAKEKIKGAALRGELEKRGIVVRCRNNSELAEEAPHAYKDVDEVVQVMEQGGCARRVARVVPIAVIKGG
jgi:tRNA-splicing ligase RtcB